MNKIMFTISARGKQGGEPVLDFLSKHFSNIPLANIDSIFAFLERSSLYGGRPFTHPELSEQDLEQLYSNDIGVRIPLSNHYVDYEEYALNSWLLDRHHKSGNAVIITNDDLARWVREDFPNYRIEASVIKNINSHDRLDQALELYDTVVLPMNMNNDREFLASIDCKERITLFGNAGCAMTCPSRICYPAISKMNKYTGAEFACSRSLKQREILGVIDFDLQSYIDMGFTRFKMLRSTPAAITCF